MAVSSIPVRVVELNSTWTIGTRRAMPVYLERSVLDLPLVYVNGGSRGFLVGVDPKALARLVNATPVDVAIEG